MEHISTRTIAPHQKVAFWNDVTGDTLTAMEIRPRGREQFEGSLDRDTLGPLGISRASSSMVEIRRMRAHIARSTERVFLIHMAATGDFTVSQRGREAMVRQGDFTITDSSEPFLLSHERPCTAIVVRVPEAMMRPLTIVPEELAGCVISGRDGLGAVASGLMTSVCQQMYLAQCPPNISSIAHSFLDIVAAACAPHLKISSESRTASARRALVRRYIECHLQDPELTPSRIATAFRISGRHARSVFEGEEEAMSDYIRRRRLEECARYLLDQDWAKRSVSEVAFHWGFNSLGSFCRAFKTKYAVTPSEYRAAAKL